MSEIDQQPQQRVPNLIPPVPYGFGYQEEHELARNQARRFLTEHCPTSRVRELAEDPAGYDKALWKQLVDLGWLGLSMPERFGGGGLDHLHLALLLEEMGRCLLPSPFIGSLLAAEAIRRSRHDAHKGQFLPEILNGNLTATLAWAEPDGAWGPHQVTAHARPKDGAWILEGTKSSVLFGAAANLVVVPCIDHKAEVGLFLLDMPSAGAEWEPEVGVDSTRRTYRLQLDGVRLRPDRRLQGDGAEIFAHACMLGWAALAAEMVGAAEAVMQLTRAYACDRQQFGKPIGAFQAVKHPIVNAMMGIEQARSLVLGAACALDVASRGGDLEPAQLSARMAKAYAGDVLGYAAKKGVQLHGGIGFTWDCDVQLYFKRMLYSRATLGDTEHHARALGETLFAIT